MPATAATNSSFRVPQPCLNPAALNAATPTAPPAPPVQPEDRVAPTGAERYRLAVTINAEGYALLEQIQALMSHRKGGRDMGAIVTEALGLLRDRLEKERFGSPRKNKSRAGRAKAEAAETQPLAEPNGWDVSGERANISAGEAVGAEQAALSGRSEETGDMGEEKIALSGRSCEQAEAGGAAAGESGLSQLAEDDSPRKEGRSRHIPNKVRRAVYDRDGGRCTFMESGTGRRCSSRRVQLHHLHPWCRGGTHAEDNLTLRCPAHNALAAEEDLGPMAVQFRNQPMQRGLELPF